MSETVPVHIKSRGEYDLFYPDHVKAQKLARHVIYTLMLEIEGDEHRSGAVTAQLTTAPSFGEDGTSAAVTVGFLDDDAQPAFAMGGMIKNDELYLTSSRLVLVHDGSILEHGYFLSHDEEIEMAIQLQELVGSTNFGSVS